MSASGERLAQSRLAILEHIQQKKESPGVLRAALGRAARAAGFGRRREPPQPAAAAAGVDEVHGEEEAARLRLAAAERAQATGANAQDPAAHHARRAQRLFSSRFAGLGEAGRAYWHQHPARLVVELATPAMSSFAQRRPVSFLALSAAAGAVVYVARPWRLISVTGLALTALRSPQISSALISALYGSGSRDDTPPTPPA